jgi:hypothetical protein
MLTKKRMRLERERDFSKKTQNPEAFGAARKSNKLVSRWTNESLNR